MAPALKTLCDSVHFVDPGSGFCNLPVVKAIDPEIARQLAAELPHDVFVGVVRTFEADLARLVQQMVDALKAGEMDSYRRNAHSLAGAAGAIGARRLEALARQAMSPGAPPAAAAVLELGAEARAALAELMSLSSADPPEV
jgi:HPt (histidine-containing phosphotransfer) domain-containing protein